MKAIIVSFFLLSFAFISDAANPILTLETFSNLTYRIKISPGTNAVAYEKEAFEPPSPGLCPGGAIAYLKTKRGAPIRCDGSDDGYSSARMSSQITLTNTYVSLAGTNDFVSRSYDMPVILGGIQNCPTAKSAHDIKVAFQMRLRVNGVESNYTAESEWFPIPAELLKALKSL
jgi:hypothetical protein